MSGLRGKVVIITGASAGIGAQTAVEFAKAGARLALVARRQDRLVTTSQSCIEAGLETSQVLTVVADILKTDDLQRVVDETVATFGSIDVLVNNAGTSVHHSFENTSLEEMDQMYDIHVRAVFSLTKLALPHLKKSKGNVVNVSSMVSLRMSPGAFAYSVAKCAQDHMMKGAALELGPQGIRVNSVCPGAIETEIFSLSGMSQEAIDKFRANECAVSPARRFGEPREVARTILFLASDDASFVSGVSLAVDAGLHNKDD